MTDTTKSVTSNTTRPHTTAAASRYQQLRSHLAALRLHTAAEHLPTVLDQAVAEGLSLTAALERLLAVEVDATEARRLAGRLRFACLPTPATLDDFDYDTATGADRHLITELGSCRYLHTATNVIMIGPPGVGKTHLAVGLARAAAHAGYRTYFTTAADSPPAATAPPSKADGPPPCASTPAPRYWPLTNWGICRCPPKPPPHCSRSSPSAT
jgi:hypothetical protein